MRPRRIGALIGSMFVAFFVLNYSWTHAAIASAVKETSCPEHLVAKARIDVATVFDEVLARPVIMCIDAPVAGLRVEYGTTRFAPLLPAIIVLGPRGQNSDVAAHEVAHAEFAEQTSVLLRTYRIPTWFDEGLAMQLDHRENYTRDRLQHYLAQHSANGLSLDSIARPSGFYQIGDEGWLNYAFAKCVVEVWLVGAESDKIITSFLDRLSWTAPFPKEEFRSAEAACKLSY